MLAEFEIEQQEDEMEGGWLTDAYDYEPPRRGQIREGVILKVEEYGAMIDVGLKRDGFVPQTDLQRLEEEELAELKPNQEVSARVVKPRDRDGNLILSLYETRTEEDWVKAEELSESGEVTTREVIRHNKGGLIVKFEHLEGFIPASHLIARNIRGLSGSERQAELQKHVGEELSLKIIEVNQRRKRLIFSERLAREQAREKNIERLLDELVEGDVRKGTVSRLVDFGAFVDLGGADGLIHISELAWQKVRHPSEVLREGEEVNVYVQNLDHERKRISLSLKRLQPDPWTLVDTFYSVGQLVLGQVANVVDFGAFVELDIGIQGLLHISELSDPPPEKPQEVVQPGDELVLRVLRMEPARKRLALSLKSVSDQEREEWLARQAEAETPETDEEGVASPVQEPSSDVEAEVDSTQALEEDSPESTNEEPSAETISTAFAG